MIPASELAALKLIVNAALPFTATIKRNTSSTFALGQPTETWTTEASGVACGVRQPTAAIAAQYANLIGSQESTVLKFPDGTDVQAADQVIVNSQTWLVQAPLTPQDYSLSNCVLATRVV